MVNQALVMRANLRHYLVWQTQAQTERRFTYWGTVATAVAEGKDLRVFGLGGWLVDRHQSLVRRYLAPISADERRQNIRMWHTAVLTYVPLAVVYYLVAVGTAGGRATIAT